MASTAIRTTGRLITFAVFDKVLTGAMFARHFRMAIGTDVSERLTSVAADNTYSLLYEFDWLIVQMVNENPVGFCLVKLSF